MQTIKNAKIAVPNKDGSFAISKERYDKLLFAEKQEEKVGKEQIIKQRNDSIKFNKVKIKQLQREVDFKKDELKNGIVETTSITNPQTGITSGFKGGFKPSWLIDNEIEGMELQIEMIEANQKNLQEETKKDV